MQYSILFLLIVGTIIVYFSKKKFDKPDVEIKDVKDSNIDISSTNSKVTIENVKDSNIKITTR